MASLPLATAKKRRKDSPPPCGEGLGVGVAPASDVTENLSVRLVVPGQFGNLQRIDAPKRLVMVRV